MFTLIAFLIAALAVGFAIVIARQNSRAQARFADILVRGVRTQALVVQLNEQFSQTTNIESSDMPSYFPVVSFDTPQGPVEAQVLIGARPAPAKKGQLVQVCYDPSKPQSVLLDKKGLGSASANSCLSTALAVVLTVFAVLVLLFWFVVKILFHVPI